MLLIQTHLPPTFPPKHHRHHHHHHRHHQADRSGGCSGVAVAGWVFRAMWQYFTACHLVPCLPVRLMKVSWSCFVTPPLRESSRQVFSSQEGKIEGGNVPFIFFSFILNFCVW
ncbi:hypothetical protein E2C01_087882 [Portunus trituberculatus]|uniref:Uncharacterized protein n=1 Tax=Portunus trituberculatus TaxID=210409 RepID=A0A5B7JF90_PORTR|nr:hypothetical protein [Portunus trituberculatus]